jgi:outer membrane lipoprotein-sorting protein
LKRLLSFLFGLILILSLAACGAPKTKEDVITALDKKVEKMSGYKSDVTLTINNGVDPQTYDVEVWYSKPTYYRVDLKNAKRNQHQMILRNDEGVFVVTPALNKSFRFQSDWPMNSSQAYLLESLVRDVKKDKDAQFSTSGKDFVFETKTNYQNSQILPTQEIAFNKDTLAPSYVKIKDTSGNVMVEVKFNKVSFDVKYKKDAFDLKKNMSSAIKEMPVMGDNKPQEVVYPQELPEGVSGLKEKKEVSLEDGKRIILTYEGSRSFTLIQEMREASTVSTIEPTTGELVNLGATVGVLNKGSLSWTYEGVDYYLASENLTDAELIEVAGSMQGMAYK